MGDLGSEAPNWAGREFVRSALLSGSSSYPILLSPDSSQILLSKIMCTPHFGLASASQGNNLYNIYLLYESAFLYIKSVLKKTNKKPPKECPPHPLLLWLFFSVPVSCLYLFTGQFYHEQDNHALTQNSSLYKSFSSISKCRCLVLSRF